MKQRPVPQVDIPAHLTDAAPAQSLIIVAHPVPTTRSAPPSIPFEVWRLLRRYSHLIAVNERKLRDMQVQASDDTQVARELARVGHEIDALRAQIVTLADLPGTSA